MLFFVILIIFQSISTAFAFLSFEFPPSGSDTLYLYESYNIIWKVGTPCNTQAPHLMNLELCYTTRTRCYSNNNASFNILDNGVFHMELNDYIWGESMPGYFVLRAACTSTPKSLLYSRTFYVKDGINPEKSDGLVIFLVIFLPCIAVIMIIGIYFYQKQRRKTSLQTSLLHDVDSDYQPPSVGEFVNSTNYHMYVPYASSVSPSGLDGETFSSSNLQQEGFNPY